MDAETLGRASGFSRDAHPQDRQQGACCLQFLFRRSGPRSKLGILPPPPNLAAFPWPLISNRRVSNPGAIPTTSMNSSLTLFISMFTTLLAIINPLEAIPVFLGLMKGKEAAEQNRIARRSCLYAMLLAFFFLLFGTLLLRLFGVPLSMIRVAGGIILTRIGFQMFDPSPQSKSGPVPDSGNDVSFIPLAMPIMFGPGAIATIIGMASTVKQSSEELASFAAISLAIVATMGVTCLSLIYSKGILEKVGPKGIDAATRVVGFFVSAMGMGLVFHGVVEFLQSYGIVGGRVAGL